MAAHRPLPDGAPRAPTPGPRRRTRRTSRAPDPTSNRQPAEQVTGVPPMTTGVVGVDIALVQLSTDPAETSNR